MREVFRRIFSGGYTEPWGVLGVIVRHQSSDLCRIVGWCSDATSTSALANAAPNQPDVHVTMTSKALSVEKSPAGAHHGRDLEI